MRDVLAAIDRMEGTVNDVLDFRKLDAEMFVMNRKPTALLTLIDSVCRHCRPFLPRCVEFGYRVHPRTATVMVDPRRVFQIITNGLRYLTTALCCVISNCRLSISTLCHAVNHAVLLPCRIGCPFARHPQQRREIHVQGLCHRRRRPASTRAAFTHSLQGPVCQVDVWVADAWTFTSREWWQRSFTPYSRPVPLHHCVQYSVWRRGH